MDPVKHIAIIGAGATGAALAYFLSLRQVKVTVLEAKTDVGFGVSKANSGIVHGGFHLPVSTLEGRLELQGNQMFKQLAEELHFSYDRCGIIMAAFSPEELKTVEGYYRRGVENNVPGIEWCPPERLRELEPGLADGVLGGVLVPDGGVVEPYSYVFALCNQAKRNGAEILTDFRVTSAKYSGKQWHITAADGRSCTADYAVNAAGLYADQVSQIFGGETMEILPRKGDEYLLDRNISYRPRHVIFPVPTEHSKGVLVIPTAGGTTMVGPTARMTEDKEDTATTAQDREEVFALAEKMIPGVSQRDIIASFCGLRPVLQNWTGKFMLCISDEAPALIQAAGIQSPGLTASPAVALYLIELLEKAGLDAPPKNKVAPLPEYVKPLREMTPEEADLKFQEDPAWTRIVCRCEMVSEAEIVRAIRLGHTTLDGVKFFTRAGMGRCQAGFCTARILEIIARETGRSVEEITKRGGASRIAVKPQETK